MKEARKILWGNDLKQITQLLVDNNNVLIDKFNEMEKNIKVLQELLKEK